MRRERSPSRSRPIGAFDRVVSGHVSGIATRTRSAANLGRPTVHVPFPAQQVKLIVELLPDAWLDTQLKSCATVIIASGVTVTSRR
jgi:hypothetical protein